MGTLSLFQDSGALFSPDGRYRYRLWRRWNEEADMMVWVLLNPSTADEIDDDPTMRKCIGFATRFGFGGILVVNIFAWRATYPRDLKTAADPVGAENDTHIRWACSGPSSWPIVAGWGTAPFARHRGAHVSAIIRQHRPLKCLRKTNDAPWHPLYLPYTSTLIDL